MSEPTNDFGTRLNRHRKAAGLSQNLLARMIGVDPAYVNRMVKPGSTPPSRLITMALAHACELDLFETDRLLFAAGYAPTFDWQMLAIDYERRLTAIDRVLIGMTMIPESVEEDGDAAEDR